LEKLVSDPYLLYLANKNMFKLTKNISLSYMLPVSIKPGHTCSKEVTVLQKKAEDHHCDTKDLKELLTKMLTMSRRKRSKPG
jgi:hypothetical protein